MPLPHVANQLGLKAQALWRRSGRIRPPVSPTSRPPALAFVEVPREAGPTPAVEVEIHRPDGVRVQFRAHDPVVVLPVLRQLWEGH